jgi:hypothetical protein
MGKAGVRSLRDGFEHCRFAGKRKDGVPGSAQVVSRWDAGGVVAESEHTSSEPCLAGSAGALGHSVGEGHELSIRRQAVTGRQNSMRTMMPIPHSGQSRRFLPVRAA